MTQGIVSFHGSILCLTFYIYISQDVYYLLKCSWFIEMNVNHNYRIASH